MEIGPVDVLVVAFPGNPARSFRPGRRRHSWSPAQRFHRWPTPVGASRAAAGARLYMAESSLSPCAGGLVTSSHVMGTVRRERTPRTRVGVIRFRAAWPWPR